MRRILREILSEMIKRLLKKFLGIDEADPLKRVQDLKKKGMSIGENVHIYNSFIDETYFSLIQIGNNVTITFSCNDGGKNNEDGDWMMIKYPVIE